MHDSKEKRLAIGKQVHDGELTCREASEKYGVPRRTISGWVSQYRESITERKKSKKTVNNVLSDERAAYENMTKEELIRELILSKANELRAKKGYEVRGVGANKEFVTSDEENSK